MFEEMTEQQAREQILEMTRNYCEKYHNEKKPYQKGDRIPYASRVYDAEEMVNLVDSSLEFWLTAGRYTDEFEHASRCSLLFPGKFRFLCKSARIYDTDISASERTADSSGG